MKTCGQCKWFVEGSCEAPFPLCLEIFNNGSDYGREVVDEKTVADMCDLFEEVAKCQQ